jgi:peptidoglycan/LPS O-acetylase OafA/YrhL
VALGVLSFTFQTELTRVPLINYIAPNLIFFALGAIAPAFVAIIGERPRLSMAICVPAAIIAHVYFHLVAEMRFDPVRFHHQGLFWHALPVTLLSLAAMISICLNLAHLRLPWLVRLGTASMGIYLMHTLVAAGIRVFLAKILGVHNESCHLAAGTMAGLLIPVGIIWHLDRHAIRWPFKSPRWMHLGR